MKRANTEQRMEAHADGSSSHTAYILLLSLDLHAFPCSLIKCYSDARVFMCTGGQSSVHVLQQMHKAPNRFPGEIAQLLKVHQFV